MSNAAVSWAASSSTAVAGATWAGAGFDRTFRGELDEVRSSDLARY